MLQKPVRLSFYNNDLKYCMKALLTIFLLLLSNIFMTLAWYGHFKYAEWKPIEKLGLIGIILISWTIALFEYILQVPANRLGIDQYGGPFNIIQLKVLQEVLSISVFMVFTLIFFKNQEFKVNHVISFCFIILAVYFAFKK